MRITFAAFYVDLPQDLTGQVHQPMPVMAELPYEQLRTMFQSVRVFHPDANLVVLSDENTEFSDLPGVGVVRMPIDPLRLMEGRTEAWSKFLDIAQSHVVFLDSDMLVQADLSSLFGEDFTVGLTYRFQEQWPINAGIQFFHGAYLERGRAFMSRCIDRYRACYRDFGFWGGDQDVLRDMVMGADCSRQDSFHFSENGFDVLMLPCDLYNYSTDDANMNGYYPEKMVLHFKGPRKVHMEAYWQNHIRAARA